MEDEKESILYATERAYVDRSRHDPLIRHGFYMPAIVRVSAQVLKSVPVATYLPPLYSGCSGVKTMLASFTMTYTNEEGSNHTLNLVSIFAPAMCDHANELFSGQYPTDHDTHLRAPDMFWAVRPTRLNMRHHHLEWLRHPGRVARHLPRCTETPVHRHPYPNKALFESAWGGVSA